MAPQSQTTGRAREERPQAGELWATAGEDPALVVIRKVRPHDWGVVVVPVSFDVGMAGRGTIVLDARVSPLDVPIAICPQLLVSLPWSALARRVAPCDGERSGIDLLAVRSGDRGVRSGTAPSGWRTGMYQHLIDRLACLDPYPVEM